MCRYPIKMDGSCGYNNESECERSWVDMDMLVVVVRGARCSVVKGAGAGMGGGLGAVCAVPAPLLFF